MTHTLGDYREWDTFGFGGRGPAVTGDIEGQRDGDTDHSGDTFEIVVDVIAMFEQVEYLHSLVRTISRLLVSKKPDDLLTTGEAAAILRMSTRHLNNLKAAGKIPFIQIDGRIMYLASDIAKYIIMQKAKI